MTTTTKQTIRLVILLLLLISLMQISLAQNNVDTPSLGASEFRLETSLDSGGGTLSANGYVLSGGIGQHDASAVVRVSAFTFTGGLYSGLASPSANVGNGGIALPMIFKNSP